MRVEQLELFNFCQFHDRVVDFGGGLTAILGPNGSGKSNLLGAIRFAFTGENPNPGEKADNVNQLAAKGSRSYVRMVFSHGAARAAVVRNLYPTRPSASLTVDGENTITGDGVVNARIVELLGGLTPDILSDVVLVAQDEIFGIFDKAPAKRAEQLQRLFRLEAAAVAHDVLAKHLSRLQIPVVAASIDDLRLRCTQLQTRKAAVATGLAAIPAEREIEDAVRANQHAINSAERAARLDSELAARSRELADLWAQYDPRRVEHTAASLRAQEAQVAEADAAAGECRAALAGLANYQQYAAIRGRLDARRAALCSQAGEWARPQPPQGYVPRAQRTPAIMVATVELNTAQSAADALRNALAQAVVVCPVCGTPAVDLQSRYQAALGLVNTLTPRSRALIAEDQIAERYEQQLREYEENSAALAVQLRQLADQEAHLPVVTAVTVDEQAAKQAVDLVARLKAQADFTRGLLGQAQREDALREGMIGQLTEQVRRLTEERAVIPAQIAEFAVSASKHLTEWQHVRDARRRLEMDHGLAVQALADTERQVTQVQQALNETAALRAWESHAIKIQGLVHRDAAPRFVSQRNLQRLEHRLNEMLAEFQVPFRVTADEGLSFLAHFGDGRRQAAQRLSPGQQVALALCWRLALNLYLASSVGALYLDEPTAYLDEDHIRALPPLLARLRELAATRGLQCVIVTHERVLAPLFDAVVQL